MGRLQATASPPPGRRGVFVPAEAGGLIAAVKAARGGDDEPARRWEREARPVLRRALHRAGFDPASMDDAILFLIEEAEAAVRTGQSVACELAWISAVLAHFRIRRRRRAAREHLAHQRVAAAMPAWIELRHDGELREELLAAAARLDVRFELAIRLRLRHVDRREARLALSVELGVGPEQARKIDRRALAMMRKTLTGPRARDPASFFGIQYQFDPARDPFSMKGRTREASGEVRAVASWRKERPC